MKRLLSLLLIAFFILYAPLTVSATTDREEANRVQAMIDAISGMGEITLEKESAIREIEAAYNALTKSQKALVDATHLENALAKIQALRAERVEYLKGLIAGFGEITLEDEPQIVEAREIFEWLTIVEREGVDYITLNEAEGMLKKLQKAAAAEVDVLIDAIGYITKDSGDAIAAARTAYNTLTPGSKSYVKNLALLEQAEQIYASLVPNVTLAPSTGSVTSVRWVVVFIVASLLVIAPAIVIPIVVVTSKRRR